jgi:hypothetical protein
MEQRVATGRSVFTIDVPFETKVWRALILDAKEDRLAQTRRARPATATVRISGWDKTIKIAFRMQRKAAGDSGGAFFAVGGLVFFQAALSFFVRTNAFRLQKVKRQRDADMEAFPAEAATNRKLQQRKPGKVCHAHPRSPELWSTAVRTIHIILSFESYELYVWLNADQARTRVNWSLR